MHGPSMLPTFEATGDVVLEDRLSVHLGAPLARGDLITFVSPADPAHLVCKRVLALAGDTVCVDPTGRVARAGHAGHVHVFGAQGDRGASSGGQHALRRKILALGGAGAGKGRAGRERE